jgi:Uncharacterised nucleotidyltransferase
MRRGLRPEEELVLLMAGIRERRAAARVGELDWAAVLADLEYQGLAPLLGGRILEAAGSAAPPEFARAVADAARAFHEAGALLELTTLRIATALEATGVANVPLKGPLLARELHGDPGMRSSRDVDVLVAREDFGRAAGALAPLGWRPKAGQATDPLLHLALVHEAGLPDIELHWRVHWYEAAFGRQALARAELGPDGVRRLRAPDDLVALMLFQARDGFAGLRHPSDLAAWWDAHGTNSGPPLLARVVAYHPALRRALTASAALLDRLVGVPAHRLLDMPDRLPWASRRAIALANPLMRGAPEQITAEVSLVDGLLSPRGERIAFFRRRALPSAADLPGSSADRHLARARAQHTLRVVGRCAVGVLRSRPRAG